MSKLFAYKVELHLGPLFGWVDITADVRGAITITRGRTSEGNRADHGRCSLRLANESGNYSPRNPAGAWYGYLGGNTPLRVSAGLSGGALVGRFYGEVPAWPPGWNLTGSVRWVDVDASGILRRLGQGKAPKWSPLRRTISGSGALAHWPLEDGDDTGQGGSAVSGVPALTITGVVPFAGIASWTTSLGYTVDYGTEALADLSAGGQLAATVPGSVTAATAGGWTVGVCSDVTVGAALSGNLTLLDIATPGGTFERWRLVVTTTGRTQLIAYTGAGAATTVVDYASVITSMIPHNIAVWQSGGNIQAGYLWDSVAGYFATGSVAGTLTGVTAVMVNPDATTATTPMPTGHLAIWAGRDLAVVDWRDGAAMRALFGYMWTGLGTADAAATGEAADVRLARIWAEQGVPVSVPVVEASPVMLARQPTASLADLTEDSTDADLGYLYESRTTLGLAYRTRSSLYNQTPVTIAYTGQLAAPFAPDEADEVRNDVTAKRVDGSSARAVQTTGRLAALPPPAGVGVYQTSVELRLLDDSRLADEAGWRRHLGTVDRPRFPAISVKLAAPEWQAAPTLLVALLGLDTGGVLEVAGLPAWAAGDVRTLVTGYSETITEEMWDITYAGVPAQPYDVAQVDGAARAPAHGSTLAAALTGDAMFGGRWDFAASAQAWTGLNGSVAHDGAGALTCTPNGVAASVEARSPNVAGAAAGETWQATALVRCAVARTVTIIVMWRDAGGALLSSTSAAFGVAANTPTLLTVTGVAPASTAQAMLSVSMGSTPPPSHVLTVDEADLLRSQSMQVASTADNGPWTQDPAHFPLSLRVGEERVTVSGIGPLVSDPFARTVSGSWGVAPTGQAWQHFGSAASFAVDGSVAQHVHQVVNSGRISVVELRSTDARVRVTGSVPVVAVGAGTALTIYAIARFSDDNNFYQARLGFIPDLSITCSVRRRVAGVDTTLDSIVTGLTHVAGQRYSVELDVAGSLLRARVWQEGTPMPDWQASAVDTALTTGTKAGVRTIIDAGSGNVMPLTYSLDDVLVASPQAATVAARSVNGVISGWPAGTVVDVWTPAVVPM
ncbi:hypothetical protein ABZ807_05505 [Micromonospora sp. NPDC047548]|uniref:hypothetical protein n=1 Tax=Micromonospora sp. NPDC047548 TaxID=3155624 RepID=UPI0033DD2326